MAIFVGFAIAAAGALAAYFLSIGKTRKRKYIVWGIVTMIAIAPFLSFSIGLSYAIMEENGWAALIMFYLFPIIFVVGLILMIVGIFKKLE